MTTARILVFGDSIAYGAWDSSGGWVERLKMAAHHQTLASDGAQKIQVLNLGIGGDTSTKILQRMEQELLARQSAAWPFVFVMSYGANDERTVNGQVETPLALFEENTNKIIAIAQQYSTHIFFLGAAPIGAATVVFKGQEYSDTRMVQYDATVRRLAEAAGVRYVPVRPVFEREGVEHLYAYDGIHPNDRGHELIATIIQHALHEIGVWA